MVIQNKQRVLSKQTCNIQLIPNINLPVTMVFNTVIERIAFNIIDFDSNFEIFKHLKNEWSMYIEKDFCFSSNS